MTGAEIPSTAKGQLLQSTEQPEKGPHQLQENVDKPGDGTLQKLGDDCSCECDAPPHGLGWASHHLCPKFKGTFEANASRC
jgi:hypothetical protein